MAKQMMKKKNGKKNNRMFQTKTNHYNKAIIQGKIGDGGTNNIGKFVLQNGKRHPWKIVEYDQNENKYHIDLDNLYNKWISADDDNWSIVDKPAEHVLSTEEQTMIGVIERQKQKNIDGEISKNYTLLYMGEYHQGKSAWSGGASDCIIVGGYNGTNVILSHIDRTTIDLTKNVIQKVPCVYMASDIFNKAGSEYIKSQLVKSVIGFVMNSNKPFKIFGSTKMAISSKGDIITNFPVPADTSSVGDEHKDSQSAAKI